MGSRWVRLCIHAHTIGSLDFSRADRRDAYWAIKRDWVLGDIEDQFVCRLNALAHDWHCAAAQLVEWDEREERFEFHRREVRKTFNAVGKSLLPWYKQWETGSEKPLAQLWKEFKEREKDPVYKAKLDKIRAELRQKSDAADAQVAAMEGARKAYKELHQRRVRAQARRRRR